MSRRLDDLAPGFKEKVIELIARCVERGIAVMIVDTLRTEEEQIENIKRGVSWTANSKHLPDSRGFARAIDLAPYSVWQLHGSDKLQWDTNDPVWQQMGEIGEALGLGWGGRWKQKDMGHFEQKEFKPIGGEAV